MTRRNNIPSFLISNDQEENRHQEERGRPQLQIDPSSDFRLDDISTRASSELVSVDFDDAIGTPLLKPTSKTSSRSHSPISKVFQRRPRSVSSDRSAKLLNPKSSPLQRISSSAKRLSTDDERTDKSSISFMNELTESDIGDLKADLASALGTPTHEGAWLPMHKQISSKNSSTSQLTDSEEAIELLDIPKKSPTPEPERSKVAFADNVSYISDTNLRPISPTPQPSSPHSPSKTIEDVYHEFTTRIKSVRRPDVIRQSSYMGSKPAAPGTSGLESSDDEAMLPLEGLGVTVGTVDQLRLYGKSVKLFSPTSSFRLRLANMFLKTWPYHAMRVLLILQTALLSYRQWNPYAMHGFVIYGTTWVDWALFVINNIYTVEIVFKIIAFGLWDDSEMFKALDKDYTPVSEILRLDKIKSFMLGVRERSPLNVEDKPVLKHSVTFKNNISKDIPIQRAFLRSSWHRLDFISTMCFWIDFFFSINRFSALKGIPLFRALACLRILRLVDVTDRIALILKSIKNGAPQLFDMFLFILYFWVLFAIIGVQSFKSSLRRTCVWTNPDDPTETYNNDEQFCGGYLEPGTLKKMPYINEFGVAGAGKSKGFLCPVNTKCMTGENPYGGTIGFDNILYSLEMVFVIMSANTFTDIMYDVMDTDTMAASLFYIFGIFFLFLWMINLLIAVISASFKATRDKEHKHEEEKNMTDFKLVWEFPRRTISKVYLSLKWVFEWAIIVSLVLQACTNDSTTDKERRRAFIGESIITLILLFEIIVRFFLYHPNYKVFLKDKRNWVDVALAVITSIMIIPPVHSGLGRAYDWMRAFQIVRFYRVILLFRFARKLWAQVWSTITIIFNLALFYFILLFLSSIILSRYFEGFVPQDALEDDQFSLQNLPNTFVALYTITSTENWTSVLYRMTEYAPNKSAGAFGACLIIAWFLLSNSLVLNIFIAIIADSLEVSEKEKRKEQVRKFVLVDFPNKVKSFAEKTLLSEFKAKIFKNDRDQTDNQQQVMNLLLNGVAIQEFLKDEIQEQQQNDQVHELPKSKIARFWTIHYHRLLEFTWFKKIIISLFWTSKAGDNPFYNKKKTFLQSDGDFSLLPRNFELETNKTIEARRKFLQENPGFNTALYILSPNQPLRKLCQKITSPSVGKRYDGVQPNKYLHGVFMTLIAFSTMAVVIIACYSTPLYKKMHSSQDGIWDWTFDFEVAFAILFLVEFLIKVIADGLIFTPNAYFQSSWNVIDFIVLQSLWINIIAIWKGNDGLSRVVRGLKALRALRLLTISNTSKNIFHKVLIVGVWKIVNAAFLSFTLLLPFSIWGQNLFSGRLGVCNDGDLSKSECYNEYTNEIFDWEILSPRVYSDPQLEFNRFASALLTLFECLSLEGWTDLLQNIVNSTGKGSPAGFWSSPGDGIFIIAFNFLGIIFVLALFVSVIISNYSKTTGSAFMTLQQRSWTEVKKLLSQNHPRKRPELRSLNRFRQFCFKYAVERNRYVSGGLHMVLWIHILAILLEMYPSTGGLDDFRYTVYICSSSIFTLFILMKLTAMGFKTFFKVKWNIYQLFVFLGAFCTSFASFFVSRSSTFANFNKLFLVGIFTVLIPTSNRLSHLLKIASASIPSLLSLIFTWGILFLVFAIALNQIFGLTKLGPNTNANLNLRTVTKSLLLLFRGSFGEAWNYTMRDFGLEEPFCSVGEGFSTTDCGNEQYAYILFIIWNILSMYIFVNMFISLIFENFSYVYSDNGSKVTLNREEIRNFKTVWQRFDPHGTGFISPEQLPVLLRALDGYFSFKIYEGNWTIPELKKKWFEIPDNSADPYDIFVNFAEVNKTLANLDVKKVRERTRAFDRFIEEAILNMELNNEPGIAFSRIILQIPLYSRFEESNCLTLSDFMDRLLVSKKVEKRIEMRRQLAVLEMITTRWKFKHRHDNRGYYNDSIYSAASTAENPFERRSLTSQGTGGNPFNTPAIVVTENDNESLKAYKAKKAEEQFAPEYFSYRKDVTPRKNRTITGSLEIPDEAVASPVLTPVANKFTTDNSYWSPPKNSLQVDDGHSVYESISDLSESFSRSDWGDIMREVHVEHQTSVNKNKREEKKDDDDDDDYETDNVDEKEEFREDDIYGDDASTTTSHATSGIEQSNHRNIL